MQLWCIWSLTLHMIPCDHHDWSLRSEPEISPKHYWQWPKPKSKQRGCGVYNLWWTLPPSISLPKKSVCKHYSHECWPLIGICKRTSTSPCMYHNYHMCDLTMSLSPNEPKCRHHRWKGSNFSKHPDLCVNFYLAKSWLKRCMSWDRAQ